MPGRAIKMRPSAAKKIREKIAARKAANPDAPSQSATYRAAIVEYGNGRARRPEPIERFTEQIAVFAEQPEFQRAYERAKLEKRPLGEALEEILLRED